MKNYYENIIETYETIERLGNIAYEMSTTKNNNLCFPVLPI